MKVQLDNMVEAFVETDFHSKEAINRANMTAKVLEEQRARTKMDMEKLASKLFPEMVEILESIPGVGTASAISVLAGVGRLQKVRNQQATRILRRPHPNDQAIWDQHPFKRPY